MKTIIFIGASHVSAHAAYEACKILKHNAVFIVDRKAYRGDTLTGIPVDLIIDADTSSCDSVLCAIRNNKVNGVSAVLSLTDRAMRTAILVGLRLKVATPDKTLLYVLQKEVVSHLVPEFSPETSTFTISDPVRDNLRDMMNKFGRLVIKPSESSASAGTFFVTSEAELEQVSAHIRETYDERLVRGTWLAQQCIEGQFFSLEGYVHQGAPTFLGATLRKRVGNTLTAALFPGEKRLPLDIVRSARMAVRELSQRSGYRNGYFHSEFIADETRAYLVDANFGRIAGGSISQLIADAHSVPLSQVMVHVISLCLNQDSPVDPRFAERSDEMYLGITYGVRESCTLRTIHVPSGMRSRHVALVNEGDHVSMIGVDGGSWIGILMGREYDVLQEICRVKLDTGCGREIDANW